MSGHRLDPLPPDAPRLADDAAAWRGCYVHVPFCARRCPYCDFAVVAPGDPGSAPGPAGYLAAVVAEIRLEEPWGPLDAVSFGGGTPSRLPAADLAAILRRLEDRFGLAPAAEVSLEANPEDWSDRYGAALLEGGFTRVSFGVQSLDGRVLADLGRRHTPEAARAAVRSARRVGFGSINVDLIFGSPAESNASWRRTVEEALALEPDHLSGYALTVERGTALSRSVAAGAPGPDADVQADRYRYLAGVAAGAGLVRYEVSNWARPGHPCRYNLATWARGEYVAFGPGAHDHREGVRSRNVRRLDAYVAAVAAGRRPRAGREHLVGLAADAERVVLGLRRAAGVVAGAAGARLVTSAEGRRLMAAGLLERREDRLVVRDPLLTDVVSRAVLSVCSGDC